MVDSVNIDTGRDVYTVGLGMNKGPVQFPAGFQKGTHNTEPTHTQSNPREKEKRIEKIKLYIDSCLFFFCATTAASSTRSRPNRQTDTTLCPFLLKTNFTRCFKAARWPQGSRMFVQTTAKVLRRDLLQIVRIICKKDLKN